MDFKRMQYGGGMLVDGTGDIATTSSPVEELSSMIATRVQGDVDAYQLYQICSGLRDFEGSPVNTDTELSIQRAVTTSLTKNFMPAGSFTVQTIAVGNEIEVYIYVGNTLIATGSVSL